MNLPSFRPFFQVARMRRFTSDQTIPADARGASIALGNFDGVHRGHRAVIEAAREAAARLGAPLGAAVFTPHPRRFFQPDAPPFQLQSPGQRARALAALGVELIYELGFDAALSKTSDEEFSALILAGALGVKSVSVGADFRYGRGRAGDGARLIEQGRAHGFGVSLVAPFSLDAAEKVSSSSIRDCIAQGDMHEAARLLGRPFAIEGEVQRGFARGRELGFPTMNLSAGSYVRPRAGVYAVYISFDPGASPAQRHEGVASFGVNPTIGALAAPVLETYVFDFDQDVYGRVVEIELISHLRDEAKFTSLDALARQIGVDVENARAALAATRASA
jgi:riboflavin kinase/FMN adenylyltransferase